MSLIISGKTFHSRLIVGSGKYKDFETTKQATLASGAEMITVAVRRVNIMDKNTPNLLEYFKDTNISFLPNSAGCVNAREAITLFKLVREGIGIDFIKLEIIGDSNKTLYPDVIETLEATKVLAKEGFKVLVYTNDDPVMAMTVVILAISFVLVLIFSILGIVFSAISLSRCRLSPQEFDRKRGMVTTTIVFSIIVAILEIVGLFTEFNIFNLIFSIVLVVAIVFMFIDRSKNKKLLRMGDNDFSEINYESVSSTKNFNKNDE